MKTKFRISILLITLLGLMSATSDSWAQKSHAHEVTFTPEKLIVPAEGGTFKIQMKALGYYWDCSTPPSWVTYLEPRSNDKWGPQNEVSKGEWGKGLRDREIQRRGCKTNCPRA